MAKYVASNTSYNVRVEFKVDGEYVEIASDATYTLRDNAGAVVDGLSEEPIVGSSGRMFTVISIPSSANVKSLANEVRYLEVQYSYEGSDYTYETYYFIRDSMRFPLSPNDVRIVLGAMSVDDEYIDIFDAYRQVQDDAPDVNLEAILTGGGVLFSVLLDAVKYKAALLAGIGVQASMFQMEQADNTMYKRFDNVDFAGQAASIADLYAIALRRLTGVNSATSTYPLSTIALGTDPVTGQ